MDRVCLRAEPSQGRPRRARRGAAGRRPVLDTAQPAGSQSTMGFKGGRHPSRVAAGSRDGDLSQGRIVLAFLLAPALAAASVGVVMALIGLASGMELTAIWIGSYAAIIGYLWLGWIPTLFLGVPAFFVLRRWLPVGPAPCALTGAGVVAVTVVLGGFLLGGFTGAATVRLFQIAGLGAVVGAYGGWMFWLIGAWRPGRMR